MIGLSTNMSIYTHIHICRFFVIANAAVGGYLVLSLPFSIACIVRPQKVGPRLLLIILDTVTKRSTLYIYIYIYFFFFFLLTKIHYPVCFSCSQFVLYYLLFFFFILFVNLFPTFFLKWQRFRHLEKSLKPTVCNSKASLKPHVEECIYAHKPLYNIWEIGVRDRVIKTFRAIISSMEWVNHPL